MRPFDKGWVRLNTRTPRWRRMEPHHRITLTFHSEGDRPATYEIRSRATGAVVHRGSGLSLDNAARHALRHIHPDAFGASMIRFRPDPVAVLHTQDPDRGFFAEAGFGPVESADGWERWGLIGRTLRRANQIKGSRLILTPVGMYRGPVWFVPAALLPSLPIEIRESAQENLYGGKGVFVGQLAAEADDEERMDGRQ